MILVGELAARLQATTQKDLYKIITGPSPILVEEAESDGRARVTFTAAAGRRCVAWKIQGKLWSFLKDSANADGAFFVERDDGDFDAHIVECKRTVTQDSWSKAKRQMFWTLLRLRALAGVLGVPIARVVFYTAYCDDELLPDSSPEPAESKIPLGDDEPVTLEDAADVEARQRQFDWEGAAVNLRDFKGEFPHRKVQLRLDNGIGVGEHTVDDA